MLKTFCDRCGKEIRDDDSGSSSHLILIFDENRKTTKDLCPNCTDEALNFLSKDKMSIDPFSRW